MKNLLKKLHIVPSPSEDAERSTSSRGGKSIDESLPDQQSHHASESKALSSLSGWLNSVAGKPNSRSNAARAERMEPSDSGSSGSSNAVLDASRCATNSPDPEIEEEYQIQLALEMSAREDPEAVQIEAVKQISLGSYPLQDAPAQVVAFRYWNYNALSYDDKILDGFYDVYVIISESVLESMPSLDDLRRTPLSDNINWEAVLVNRAGDANLSKLERKALGIAANSSSDFHILVSGDLVQKLAKFVSEYMGGPVGDPDNMSRAWRSLSYSLKSTLRSMVLPLGSLTIGLARHRALLFKVLSDALGIPCRLVKGQHSGFDSEAMNFVKMEDGREYIVDLMADPGTLIPSDAAGFQLENKRPLISASPSCQNIDSSHTASLNTELSRPVEDQSRSCAIDKKSVSRNFTATDDESKVRFARPLQPDTESKVTLDDSQREIIHQFPMRSVHSHTHARSPSWTEGISSPAARNTNVKDVSQFMIDAAKENPCLAQKLHDVLLESGVVAPPNLFTQASSEQSHGQSMVQPEQQLKAVEGLGFGQPLQLQEAGGQPVMSRLEGGAVKAQNVPVAAAAAAAAAAVVASSMIAAAAAKPNNNSDMKLPAAAAAAATATAAAAAAVTVAATTAAVGKTYGGLDSGAQLGATVCNNQMDCNQDNADLDSENDALGLNPDAERVSDKSMGHDSVKSDAGLNDVADCEISWEDITLGERVGLGSYGEVYHGDLYGTEVAVKRFLDQDISGESLEEFKTEVRIMKRLRHPNVVLFMGAITSTPNLSIVTEFLPRSSLYRLIHRPNNQLDERRRLRMALDTARGMNYLHNCTPMIVHRDLKSPNLLVDKNWVVKVCDFGLSRMKHSTFLSSRSTAGTAEWMAPEVLRNEPSDEKCDVYSFGVILWELCTLQQPWAGMNPMQVVGAVGFQHRRLDVPDHVDPAVAAIIWQCWHTEPRMRPSFSEIMAALKPLQKPVNRQGGGARVVGRVAPPTCGPGEEHVTHPSSK